MSTEKRRIFKTSEICTRDDQELALVPASISLINKLRPNLILIFL